MKIGLLTVYSFNYGSYYQATALLRQLQKMGHDCELINEEFKKKEWTNLFLLYTFHRMIPPFMRPVISKVLPQYNTFLKLQKDVEKLPQSTIKQLDISKLSEKYDCIVLGSDELWSANPASIRYTPAYFGYGLNCPHIAYAPSATLFDLKDEQLCEKVRDGLNSYAKIAVRDEHSRQVVEKVTGRKVPVVLDPTLLNPYFVSEEDEKGKGEYVLLYGQHYDEEQKELILKTAQKRNMKIYALGWPQDFADGFLNPETAEAFQRAFSKADYCFPSTFHGTIFSILHKKPFLSMLNPLRGGKVKMLLEQLNLSERIYHAEQKDMVDKEINYQEVEAHLTALQKDSLAYLENALQEIKTVSAEQCCGCQACTAICPKKAIHMEKDEEGFLYPVIDQEKCIHCGACEQICPMRHQKKSLPQKVYGCRTKRETECLKSSSGGAFRLLSDHFLKEEEKGVVAGAVFQKDFSVTTVLTDEIAKRDLMCGSKYVQSNMTDLYANLSDALKDGKKVLFTGTPCQCAGVKNYAEYSLKQWMDNLYLCDIVCHGTPSPEIWKAYINRTEKKENSKITDVTFRSKHFGWHKQAMEIQFQNGHIYREITTKDPFYIMYFSHVCHRASCHQCPFASYERCSDLTMGDFWGIENIKKNQELNSLKVLQDEKGTSLLFVNTDKGLQLWKKCMDKAVYVESNLDECYQAIFENPPKKAANRDAFWESYRKKGYEETEKVFGRLHTKQKIVKFVIAPLVKKLGIYNFAQKIYFGKRKKES